MARILVIDDFREVRNFLWLVLEAAGHEVIETANGAQALGVYKGRPAELIFCDLFMPEKEGLATIREMREHWPDVKIIAMSGGNPRAPTDLLPQAAKLGAVKTLRKPFGPDDVLAVVTEVLGEQAPAEG